MGDFSTQMFCVGTKIQQKSRERRLKAMDFVTTTNVVIDCEKNADNRAALLAYDTLLAAKKNKERKEKGHA